MSDQASGKSELGEEPILTLWNEDGGTTIISRKHVARCYLSTVATAAVQVPWRTSTMNMVAQMLSKCVSAQSPRGLHPHDLQSLFPLDAVVSITATLRRYVESHITLAELINATSMLSIYAAPVLATITPELVTVETLRLCLGEIGAVAGAVTAPVSHIHQEYIIAVAAALLSCDDPVRALGTLSETQFDALIGLEGHGVISKNVMVGGLLTTHPNLWNDYAIIYIITRCLSDGEAANLLSRIRWIAEGKTTLFGRLAQCTTIGPITRAFANGGEWSEENIKRRLSVE